MESLQSLQQWVKEQYGIETIKNIEIPSSIESNLKHSLREYQKDGLQTFIQYWENIEHSSNPNKESSHHLLFNMATGSGKTIMMAALILYLYEKGYRHFLFFVNRTTIIEKTKLNFIQQNSQKYLFKDSIHINGQIIPIRLVDNFEGCDDSAINLHITTIQGLHSELTKTKENGLSFEDLKKHKMVLLADEAHHLNTDTKNKTKENVLFSNQNLNWENTVLKIFNSNQKNICLEFTATIDWANQNVKKKYLSKCIYEYDLKRFYREGFSKNIDILVSNVEPNTLMLQAVVLSEYRNEIAFKYNIPNFKSVILFKSKNIQESKENQQIFFNLINNLKVEDLTALKSVDKYLEINHNQDIINLALSFFEEKYQQDWLKFISQVKRHFLEQYSLNTNTKEIDQGKNKEESKQLQQETELLNTLEDAINPIRTIFTVDKLNEGWDVLNLFDIVRLYDTRDQDTKSKKPGKTTISEAQLIGRGARYYPFIQEDEQEKKYIRKYDVVINDERTILETLYYHSFKNSRYISELKDALNTMGLIDSNKQEFEFRLDDGFDKKLQSKKILINQRKLKNDDFIKQNSLKEIDTINQQLQKKSFSFNCPTNERQGVNIFSKENNETLPTFITKNSDNIPFEIRLSAWMNSNISFNQYRFPSGSSTRDFIQNLEYSIQFQNFDKKIISDEESYYRALKIFVYPAVNKILTQNFSEYCGSSFTPKNILPFFKQTKIKSISEEKQENLVWKKQNDCYFYAQNCLIADSTLEIEILPVLKGLIQEMIKQGYNNTILLRNEQQLALYHPNNGKAFYPDFLLLTDYKQKQKQYQIFIEVKGEFLQEYDRWKEDFLKQIEHCQNQNYTIISLPFYPTDPPAEWNQEFKTKLSLQ